jgi:hypothetical protein
LFHDLTDEAVEDFIVPLTVSSYRLRVVCEDLIDDLDEVIFLRGPQAFLFDNLFR